MSKASRNFLLFLFLINTFIAGVLIEKGSFFVAIANTLAGIICFAAWRYCK